MRPLANPIALVELIVGTAHAIRPGPGHLYRAWHCWDIVLPEHGGVTLQIGSGNRFLPLDNVAFDPGERLLVQSAGTLRSGDLRCVDAPIIDAGQPGFYLALPLLSLRVAPPVRAAQRMLIAGPGRKVKRIQRCRRLAQGLLNGHTAGISAQFAAITQYRLAKAIGVSQRRIGEIVSGDRTVTADTGLRLSRYFGVSDKFWIGLQADFDAAMTKEKLADMLARIEPYNAAV